ncbi:DEKNAAC101512 [Brettanomyces naardenensis]|uniref:DEKNAAC101512 n=1 Tax=Brettanomyces naardenensis TaxID=13370 RepID=A0A448YI07_BRENA|nr:DEKNAAC101512 [Brettanomyces naardenensis]
MTEYTKEQREEVERIMEMDCTDYYSVLKLEKGATETQIKKSYRRLAMKLHPDKNKHPQSAEAFKKIAKAFEILGDEKKRNYYDQTGVDPDSRGMSSGGNGGGRSGGGGATASGYSPFAGDGSRFFYTNGGPFGGPGGRGMFDDDLFDMLFGGNNGGFTFGFDGNGFRRANFGNGNPFFARAGGGPGVRHRTAPGNGNRRHRRANGAGGENGAGNGSTTASPWAVLYQYLPLLLVLIPMLFNLVADSFTNGTGIFDKTPSFSFETSPSYSVERTSPRLGIHYYITPDSSREMNNRNDAGKTSRQLDNKAEDVYVTELKTRCRREQNIKEKMIEDSYGFFFVDKDKLAMAQNFEAPSCNRLRELNLL